MMLAVLTAAVIAQTPVTADSVDPMAAASHGSWLKQAAGACESRDFNSLFESFVRSAEVRRRYSAPQIELRTLADPRAPGTARPLSPDAFEIALIDYSYADAASVRRWEIDPARSFTLLSVEQKHLADGAVRIDYRPGLFRDDGEGDGRTLVRPTGAPAAYVFSRFGGCWRLTQHLR